MLCLMVSLELQFEVMPQRPSLESRFSLMITRDNVITRDNMITISFLVITLGRRKGRAAAVPQSWTFQSHTEKGQSILWALPQPPAPDN